MLATIRIGHCPKCIRKSPSSSTCVVIKNQTENVRHNNVHTIGHHRNTHRHRLFDTSSSSQSMATWHSHTRGSAIIRGRMLQCETKNIRRNAELHSTPTGECVPLADIVYILIDCRHHPVPSVISFMHVSHLLQQ